MSSFEKNFFVVPFHIIKLVGNNFAYLKVYEVLFSYWNANKDCWISNKKIMSETGIKTESALRNAFIFFEKHGELVRTEERGRRYFKRPEKKIEHIEDEPTVSTETPPRLHKDGSTVSTETPTYNNNNYNKLTIMNYCSTIVEPMNFERFWSIYPRKQKKKVAKAIWIKNNLDAKADLICKKVVERTMNDPQWFDAQYVPLPDGYLRNERWNDEYSLQKVNKKTESGAERALRMCSDE